VVYAGTGTINTSDAREKQQIRSLSDTENAVAVRLKSLIKAFKFNDAVQAKGDAARIHVGVIAQEVIAAFEAEGLDANRYAIVCYDEWAAELDDDGNEIRPAGNRYGVRYEELLAFIISAL
jgi:ribosomal protein L9